MKIGFFLQKQNYKKNFENKIVKIIFTRFNIRIITCNVMYMYMLT